MFLIKLTKKQLKFFWQIITRIYNFNLVGKKALTQRRNKNKKFQKL